MGKFTDWGRRHPARGWRRGSRPALDQHSGRNRARCCQAVPIGDRCM